MDVVLKIRIQLCIGRGIRVVYDQLRCLICSRHFTLCIILVNLRSLGEISRWIQMQKRSCSISPTFFVDEVNIPVFLMAIFEPQIQLWDRINRRIKILSSIPLVLRQVVLLKSLDPIACHSLRFLGLPQTIREGKTAIKSHWRFPQRVNRINRATETPTCL